MPLTCLNCSHDCFLEFAVGDADPMESVLICMDCGTVILPHPQKWADLTWDDLSIHDLKRLVVVCENFNHDR